MVDPDQVRQCRRLWASVLLAAARDAVIVPRSRDALRERDRARSWIGTRDFHAVCALAGLDGEAVEQGMRAMLRDPDAAERFRAPMTFDLPGRSKAA